MPTDLRGIAAAVCAALVLAAPVAAQQAAQVALIEGDAQGDYRAAGAVAAEMQSASNVLPKARLDEQLRAEAAKLGADAVIQVTYQMTPAGSGVSYKASGVAIRYSRQAGAVAAVPAPAPAVPAVVSSAAPAVASATPPVVAAVAPPVAAVAPPVVAPAPAVAAAPAAAAPVVRAASAADVTLNEGSIAGRQFVQLGPVSVTTHPTSMFMKVTPKEQTQEALKAAAFKMGADAVIEVKYQMVNSTFSRKGNTASGIAVKFQ
ncbi:MAG TPA: hypothetical protein VIA80_15715 [Hyphomonadaceae bacterium]|jgi:uncharacterized protein YbjQ (UPF0145 family)